MQKKIALRNDTQKPLEVMVEINPDRYILHPKDEMVIEGGDDTSQPYFDLTIYEGGIQIYPPLEAKVSINGSPAKPTWDLRD